MHAELANLNHCAVSFLSRAAVNLCWYYYSIYKVYCAKYIIYGTYSINCTMFGPYSSIKIIKSKQYIAFYMQRLYTLLMYTALYSLHSSQCTLYDVHYTVHCTTYIIQYIVQRTLYIVLTEMIGRSNGTTHMSTTSACAY